MVRMTGAVDLGTVDLLQTALHEVLARRPAQMIVDLSDLTFCSARGLGELGRAGDSAHGSGVGYAVAGASAALNRIWAMGWTAGERPIGFSTTETAVLAAMAHQIGAQDRARGEPQQRPGAAPWAGPAGPVTAPAA
ncbi:STAS domain-containing protein [Pseudonocardia saturnea]